MLGDEGTNLLLKIVADEQRNVKATDKELNRLDKIIARNMREDKAELPVWEKQQISYVQEIYKRPTVNYKSLINSYFPYRDFKGGAFRQGKEIEQGDF